MEGIIALLITVIFILATIRIAGMVYAGIKEKKSRQEDVPKQEEKPKQEVPFTANDARKIQENAHIARDKRIERMREDNKFKMLIYEILQKISRQAEVGKSWLFFRYRFNGPSTGPLFCELCQDYSIDGTYLAKEIASELRTRGFTVKLEKGEKDNYWEISWETRYKDWGF